MPKRTHLAATLAAGLLAGAAAGCDQRKATEADCQLIVDRLVELEMRAMNAGDAAAISKKQEAIRAAMKDELRDCVGRTVSNRMMDCVRSAEAPEKVMACIR